MKRFVLTAAIVGLSVIAFVACKGPVSEVTPGINFTTGLVLTYDDMPTLTAPVTIGEDGKASIGELQAQ